MYDFENNVLFKPTKAAVEQFRNTKNLHFHILLLEMKKNVKRIQVLHSQNGVIFDNSNIIITQDIAIAMFTHFVMMKVL